MTWHSTSPTGSMSVKANKTPMQDNTTYIETTMGKDPVGTNTVGTRDHFWAVSSDLNGHHRFFKSVGFTVGGTPTDPIVGTNLDGVIYLRQDNATSGQIQGFYRNINNIYQFIPAFVSGTHTVTNVFTTLVTVPKGVYGEIFMFRNDSNGNSTLQTADFKAPNDIVAPPFTGGVSVNAQRYTDSGGNSFSNLDFDRNNLDIRVKTDSASSGNIWQYRITYRAI